MIEVPHPGRISALPGGGFVVAGKSDDGSAIVLQTYDGAGAAAADPIIAVSGLPSEWGLGALAVSAYGTTYAVTWTDFEAGRYQGQILDIQGQKIGEPIVLALPEPEVIVGVGRSIVALPDGKFAAVSEQAIGSGFQPFLHVLSSDGVLIAGPVEVPARMFELGVDQLLTVVDCQLVTFDETGQQVGNPIHLPVPDGAGSTWTASLAERLANGDLIVAWSPPPYNGPYGGWYPEPGDGWLWLQRIDVQGNSVGPSESVVVSAGSRVVGLQDGGYAVVRDDNFQIFDRNDVAVTGWTDTQLDVDGIPDVIALRDGRFVVFGYSGIGAEAVGVAAIYDYPPSHDAQWGGMSTYIATWQEQELLRGCLEKG